MRLVRVPCATCRTPCRTTPRRHPISRERERETHTHTDRCMTQPPAHVHIPIDLHQYRAGTTTHQCRAATPPPRPVTALLAAPRSYLAAPPAAWHSGHEPTCRRAPAAPRVLAETSMWCSLCPRPPQQIATVSTHHQSRCSDDMRGATAFKCETKGQCAPRHRRPTRPVDETTQQLHKPHRRSAAVCRHGQESGRAQACNVV
jgi:hypothetical protein